MRKNRATRHTLLCALATTVPWALWGAEDPAFTVISDSPLSETYAFSAAWGDYDGDGFQDLLCLDSFPSGTAQAHLLLFTNQRNGAFAKSTLDPSMLPPGEPPGPPVTGATWGDYDNDGRLDILVNGGGWFHKSRAASFLLHQEADHTFAPAPPTLFPTGYSYAGLWADFDCDGMLDVFMGRWNSGAESNPTSDVLFRGTGSGWFVDIQAQGIYQPYENTDSVLAGTVGDFNGDGAPDVIVTTVIPTGSRIYLNNGDLSFARFLVMPDWLGGGFGGGVAAADYDNDGDLDFVSVAKSGSGSWSCACDGTYAGFCQLWRNDGTGDFERTKAGELGNLDWIGGDAAAWADYNNDGWQDLLVFRSIHSNGHQRNPADVLYRNNGDGTFSKVTEGPLVNEDGDAEAGAWADYDNDGDMDLFVANYVWEGAEPGSGRLPVLYRNEGNGNHWLKCDLTGTTSNRGAIGAKVRVKATLDGEEVWQLREIRSNTGWFAAQNDMRPHFGLADATVAETVRIEWPSGIVQELINVPADQILTIVEPVRLDLEAPNRLSWHSSKGREFDLESAPAVNGPWTPASVTVHTDGNLRNAIVQADAGAHFYRLQHTPPAPIPHNPRPDTLVWMPSGTFLMGSPESEPERESLVATTGYGDETLHQVTLTQGFWIARLETTQPEFLALMDSNPSIFAGKEQQPVDSVTWHEAVAYCEALTVQEEAAGRLPAGYIYRLPTEAEWEYACRAGTTTPFHPGDDLRSRQANFDGTREYSVAERGTVVNPAGVNMPRPAPVGVPYYIGNAWGLRDMIGNMGEWCLDRMDHYPEGPVADPYVPNPTEEMGAVVRGGAWGEPASACRSACRDFKDPSLRDGHLGFRVVLGKPVE